MFIWDSSTSLEKVAWLGMKLQARSNELAFLRLYFTGRQASTFLPSELIAQLGNRMVNVNVNYCRKTVTALTDRLSVTGFQLDGSEDVDNELYAVWKSNRMPVYLSHALNDALAYGSSYISVWQGANGPQIAVESPFQVIPYIDPQTREPLGYLKQWGTIDPLTNVPRSWSYLYLPDRTEVYVSDSAMPSNGIPSTAWQLESVTPNPFGVLPIVQLVNTSDVLDQLGHSEFSDVIPLVDWLNKACLDLVSASDSSGAPRKFLSGLKLKVDEDGNAVNPFAAEQARLWIAEQPEARMAQFDGAPLTNFIAELHFVVQQIGVVASLPEYLLGVTQPQPSSADGLRAQNLSLTTKAESKATLFSDGLGRVAALVRAIETGQHPDKIAVSPIWAAIDERSDAASTDAFVKLVQAGVPLPLAATKALGWTPQDAALLADAKPPAVVQQLPAPPTQTPYQQEIEAA